MLDTLFDAAEHAAASASRREFLGQAGGAAMRIAGVLAGILALPAVSEAARKPAYICPNDSDQACVGSPEGSRCDGFGFVGRCRRVGKGTACVCN